MKDQCNIPAYKNDRDCFKRIAAKEKLSMKDLFSKWIKGYEGGLYER